MKSKEEIENICNDIMDTLSVNPQYEDAVHDGLIIGYTKCQEDIKQKLYEFGKLVLDTFHSEGRTHSGKDRLARVRFDEWFNELNKQD